LPQAPLIAVVDDDEFFRGSMRRLLRSLDYRLETFQSAFELLRAPNLCEIACLITDVEMTGMTGVQLYERLTEAGYMIPTILVTGYPDDATQNWALKSGIVCYLQKPFNDNDLLSCLQVATRTKRQQ
jgi:FixJ family two-component response regulator